jgi:hypothetical protein
MGSEFGRGPQDNATVGQAMRDVFMGLESTSQSAMIGALSSGTFAGVGGVNDLIQNSKGFGDQNGKNAAMIRLASAYTAMAGGRGGLGAALAYAAPGMATNPMFMNRPNTGDSVVDQEGRLQAKLNARTYGTGVAESDFFGSIIRGLAGGENIGDPQVLSYMSMKGDKALMHLTRAGAGMQMDAAMLDKMGGDQDLLDALGASSKSDINDKLSSPEGVNKLLGFLESKGMPFHTDGHGGMNTASASDAARASKILNNESDARIFKDVYGMTDEDARSASYGKGTAALMGEHSKAFESALISGEGTSARTGLNAFETSHPDIVMAQLNDIVIHPEKHKKGTDALFKAASKELDNLKAKKDTKDEVQHVRIVGIDEAAADSLRSRQQ